MVSKQLDNLLRTGVLKEQAPAEKEIRELIRSGKARLRDAANAANSADSRFDLAYNACHALCYAALRLHGYRSEKRYVVFQVLPHTLGFVASDWRVLDDAHRKRNAVEYEGVADVDEATIAAMIRLGEEIARRVDALWKTHY